MLMGSKVYEGDILSNSFAWLQRKFAGLKSILNKYFLFLWLSIFPRVYQNFIFIIMQLLLDLKAYFVKIPVDEN